MLGQDQPLADPPADVPERRDMGVVVQPGELGQLRGRRRIVEMLGEPGRLKRRIVTHVGPERRAGIGALQRAHLAVDRPRLRRGPEPLQHRDVLSPLFLCSVEIGKNDSHWQEDKWSPGG